MKTHNTHLHFAILAVVTVGFLLWHSIAIFNLEQDLQILQNNTVTSSVISTVVEKPQDDTQISPQGRDDTGTDTDTESQILYNEDGSIDTSNWKTYTNEEYGFSVQYPQEWEVEIELPAPEGENDGFRYVFWTYPKEYKKQINRDGYGAEISFAFAVNEESFARANEKYKEYDISLSSDPVKFLQTYYKATEPYNEGSDMSWTGNKIITFNNVKYWVVNEVSREIVSHLLRQKKCLYNGENGPSGFSLNLLEEGYLDMAIGISCLSTVDNIYQKQMYFILKSVEFIK